MNWGYSIILACLVFIAFIMSMVVVSMQQDINLVAKDYYKEELAYQKRIDQLNNGINLKNPVNVSFQKQGRVTKITFPEIFKGKDIKGSIEFFRPSDASKDFTLPLHLASNNEQIIGMEGKSSGLWKVLISWSANMPEDGHKDFYKETSIVIP